MIILRKILTGDWTLFSQSTVMSYNFPIFLNWFFSLFQGWYILTNAPKCICIRVLEQKESINRIWLQLLKLFHSSNVEVWLKQVIFSTINPDTETWSHAREWLKDRSRVKVMPKPGFKSSLFKPLISQNQNYLLLFELYPSSNYFQI